MTARLDSAPAAPLPDHTPIGAVADEAFDRIAGLVQKVIGVPVGLVSLVDQDGQVFPGQVGLPVPWSDTRCTPLTHSFCQYVVRTREPLIVADARLDPVLRANLATLDIGVVGYAGIPLIDLDGSVVGSLCAIDTEPHKWTASEIALLTDLAALCSAELQLRTAAARARDAQTRARTLLALSETLSKTVTTDDVAHAVAQLSTGHLGAAVGGITLLDPDTDILTEVDPHTSTEGVRAEQGIFPRSRHVPTATAARTGRPLYFDSLDELRAQYPRPDGLAATPAGAQACAFLPLRGTDRTLGTLTVTWAMPRTFDADDHELLEWLAAYTAQAVERAVLLADRREVAETLQSAMLPSLPALPWVELAGRYQTAHVTNSVGGDWYDAFELPDRSLMFSVGDVAGHDIEAAAVMGQMRSTLRALAVTLPGQPAQVLHACDEVLAVLPVARFATAVLANLVPGENGVTSLSWTNAGHLAPLLVVPGLPPTFLDPKSALMLGVGSAPHERPGHVTILPPNSTLLLYTDGLVERRDVGLDTTLGALADSAQRHRELPLPDLVDAVLADLFSGSHASDGHDDDTVLFGLRTR